MNAEQAAEIEEAKKRCDEIRLRVTNQLGHFGTSSAAGAICGRCGKPFNRWSEPCAYPKNAAAMLAEDCLWLLDRIDLA